jgi:CHASE2 domain-containing sensor protein
MRPELLKTAERVNIAVGCISTAALIAGLALFWSGHWIVAPFVLAASNLLAFLNGFALCRIEQETEANAKADLNEFEQSGTPLFPIGD